MDLKDGPVAGEPKPTITQETASAAASSASASKTGQRLSCTKCFDALWFCYSPFHQMQHYYRYGEFDNCYSKWNSLVDCLSLKTKRNSEVEAGKIAELEQVMRLGQMSKEQVYHTKNTEILEAREKSKPHIWTYRTVEEASMHWWRMYSHFFTIQPKRDS